MFPDDADAGGMPLQNNLLGQVKSLGLHPGHMLVLQLQKRRPEHPSGQMSTVPWIGHMYESDLRSLSNRVTVSLWLQGKHSHGPWPVAYWWLQSVLPDLGCGL